MAVVEFIDAAFGFADTNEKLKTLLESRGVRNTGYSPIFENLSFRLVDGDRLGVAGPNGAGKTTMLRLVAGILNPTAGVIVTQGWVNPLINISLGTHEELSGYENIFLRGMYLNYSYSEIRRKVDEIIDFSELHHVIHKPLRTYSSGMKLRLAFSIATSLPCDILLLDEWLSAGDLSFREKANARMRQFVNDTSIVVLASNSAKTLRNNTNRTIQLEGRGGQPEKVAGAVSSIGDRDPLAQPEDEEDEWASSSFR